jgi:hypothetical protein
MTKRSPTTTNTPGATTGHPGDPAGAAGSDHARARGGAWGGVPARGRHRSNGRRDRVADYSKPTLVTVTRALSGRLPPSSLKPYTSTFLA